jgi:primosomal protein N' (replication factor Y)
MKEPDDSLLTDKRLDSQNNLVLKIAVPYPLRQCYDYLPPDGIDASQLRPGMRLKVPFANRTSIGYLLEVGQIQPGENFKLKRAISILDNEPLIEDDDLTILIWTSQYYHHPIGEVFATAFPTLLRQGQSTETEKELLLCLSPDTEREKTAQVRGTRQMELMEMLMGRETGFTVSELNGLAWNWKPAAKALIDRGLACYQEAMPTTPDAPQSSITHPHRLNPPQQYAVDTVLGKLGQYQTFLLEGVTGSGKTEVYLRLLEQVLERGQQAMILVPEINLTPQLEARFRARFNAPLVVFHSGLTDAERCRSWLAMQRGEASILLGTRSAVFTPMAKPGLIILDEEHDSSFKQQEGFRFHARDLAIMRARQKNIPILMGSATPSLESLANTVRGRYTLLSLPERTGKAVHPTYRLVDIRKQRLNEGLSSELITKVGETLGRGEQALLFLNRRGFAPTLICHACGWVAGCKRCDARLVMHSAERRLRCHHCGHEQALLRDCPECQTADLRPLGLGTERVELALAKLFPKARTLRIDRDSTRRKGSLEGMLDKIQAGEVDILLGTQMLAKGHHFPNVTLVGILDVDGGLFSHDFRAGERTAQMIVQVAGRAGREERPGQVLLQTRQPDHPLLRKLIREGYPVFAAAALLERYEAGLPPYSYQALWRADASDEESPTQLLTRLVELASTQAEVLALGPVPAPMYKQAGRFRQQLLLQSAKRKPLHELVDFLIRQIPNLPEAKKVRWSVDIDPLDLY